MLKFFAAAISALAVVNSVVAVPAPAPEANALEARGGEYYPIHTATSLVEVDVDALVKIAKLDILKVDVTADILKTFYRRDALAARGYPDYPYTTAPALDIDLDLIVKLAKAKIVDVDLSLDIFKGYVKRGGPEPPLLDIDLAVLVSLAKDKLIALGFLKADVLKRTNSYPWFYPLIDIDLLLIVKLLQAKLLVLDVDIDVLLKSLHLLKRGGWPGYPKSLITIDLDLIVKLIGTKIGH